MSTPKTKPNDSLQASLGALVQNAPDKLHPVLDFIIGHLRQILVGVGAVVLAVALGSGWQLYTQWQIQKDAAALGIILNGADDEAKITALTGYAAAAPKAMKTQAYLALAETAMRQEKFDLAEKAFAETAANTDDSSARLVANLGLADVALAMNNPAKGKDILFGLKTTAPDTYKGSILFQLAMAAEASGDDKTALTTWEEFAFLAPQASAGFVTDRIAMLKTKLGLPLTPAPAATPAS